MPKTITKTKGAGTETAGAKVKLAGQRQQTQQPQDPTRGLGALSKREQQNPGRWIAGAAQLLTKAGIDVPMGAPVAT